MQITYILKVKSFFFFFLLSIITTTVSAQVGINTTDPKSTLDVNGAIAVRESPSALRLDGRITVLDLGENPYSQYRIEGPTTAFSIIGIKQITDFADGQIVRFINTTNQPMSIIHGVFGLASNIACPSEENLILTGKNSSITLQFSKGLGKWIVATYAIKSKDRITVFGTTDIARQNSSWAPLDGLSITFTPENPVIYISFNAYGSISGGSADFRLLINENTEVPNSQTSGTSNNGTYAVSHSMFPIKVTPGVEIEISAQWFRRGILNQIIRNNPASNINHGRYLTIID